MSELFDNNKLLVFIFSFFFLAVNIALFNSIVFFKQFYVLFVFIIYLIFLIVNKDLKPVLYLTKKQIIYLIWLVLFFINYEPFSIKIDLDFLYFLVFLLFFLFENIKDRFNLIESLFLSILFSSVFIDLYAFLQKLHFDPVKWNYKAFARPGSFIGQPNWLALFSVFAITSAIYFLLKDNQKNRIYVFLILFFNTLTLVLTKSVSGLLSFSIVILFLFIFLKDYFFKNIYLKIYIFFLSISIFIILLLAIFFHFKFRTDFLHGVKERIFIYKIAIKMLKDNKFKPISVYKFGYRYLKYRKDDHNLKRGYLGRAYYIHNIFLEQFLYTSIIGGFAFLFFFMYSAYNYFKEFIKEKVLISLFSFAFFIAFFISKSFTVFDVVSFFIIVNLAFLSEKNYIKKIKIKKIIFNLFALFIVVLLSINIYKSFFVHYYYLKALMADNFKQKVFYLNKTLSYKEFQEPYFYYADILTQYCVMTDNVNYSKEALKKIDKAININPLAPEFYSLKASIYFYLFKNTDENKYLSLAFKNIDKAINLSPYNFSYYYKKGVFYYNINELDLAYKCFKNVLYLSGKRGKFALDSYINIIDILIRKRRYREAYNYLNEALYLFKNNKTLLRYLNFLESLKLK